jgi:CRP/FNR family cyclic AMP-dependent transcriptional regulator
VVREHGCSGQSSLIHLAFQQLYAKLLGGEEAAVPMTEIPNYINILKHTEIFNKLTPTQLEMISHISQERTYQAGDIVLYEGTATDELFVIVSGHVDVQVNPALVSEHPGAEYSSISIATLSRGQCFGEITLVDNGVRIATVRAMQNKTRLLVIAVEKILTLCDTYPQLGYRLMQNIATDLASKIRNQDLRIRAELLYGKNHK